MATNISEFSKRVQPEVMGCPRVMVDRAVIDAAIMFCEDTLVLERAFEHDVVIADVDTADNNAVTVDISDYSITEKPLSIVEFRIDGGKWEVSHLELQNDLDDISEIAIIDTKFFSFPSDTDIKFLDIEARDQRFFIKLAVCPLITMATIDDFVFRRWHSAIEAYAKYLLMKMPEKEWTNYELARFNLSIYNDGMARAKIVKDRGFVKGSQRVKSVRFF